MSKKYNDDINKKNYYGYVLDEIYSNKKKYLKEMRKQRDKYGFDNGEIFNLNNTFAKWITSRLIRFKEVNKGYPFGLTYKKWNRILDKMIEGFSLETNSSEEGNLFQLPLPEGRRLSTIKKL